MYSPVATVPSQKITLISMLTFEKVSMEMGVLCTVLCISFKGALPDQFCWMVKGAPPLTIRLREKMCYQKLKTETTSLMVSAPCPRFVLLLARV